MLKNLAIPTSLLSALLKFKEPSLLLLQPLKLDSQTLNSDFPTPSAHLGERNAVPRMASSEKSIVLVAKSPTCLNHSRVAFNGGRLGESMAPRNLCTSKKSLDKEHPMPLLRGAIEKLEFLTTQSGSYWDFPRAPIRRSLDYHWSQPVSQRSWGLES